MQWTSSLVFPLVVAAFWFYTSQITRSIFPTLRRKRICLLIAHPDDEAMFFAPTLLALTDASLGNHVKILCLSSGNADGLGEIRKKELVKSGLMLGLRSAEDVLVMDDPKFPDSMTVHWDQDEICRLLAKTFAPEAGRRSSSSAVSAPTVDVLISFDGNGVSSHANHISLYHGARAFLSSLDENGRKSLALYTLTTTNVVRKYISILDTVPTMLHLLLLRKKQPDPPSPLLYFNSPLQYRKAQKAMIQAHQSQMRWFRWGWISLSRYMTMNDLKLERV